MWMSHYFQITIPYKRCPYGISIENPQSHNKIKFGQSSSKTWKEEEGWKNVWQTREGVRTVSSKNEMWFLKDSVRIWEIQNSCSAKPRCKRGSILREKVKQAQNRRASVAEGEESHFVCIWQSWDVQSLEKVFVGRKNEAWGLLGWIARLAKPRHAKTGLEKIRDDGVL